MTISPARRLATPGNIATWLPRGQVQSSTENNKQVTYILQAPVKEFIKVRMVMRNHGTSSSRGSIPDFGGGEGFLVAVSESNSQFNHPILAGDTSAKSLTNNPTTGWCNLLWNGQKNPIAPIWDSTYGTTANRSTYAFSDWLYMPSVIPTSGYDRITGQSRSVEYPFLMISTWLPSSVPTWTCLSTWGPIGKMANLLDKGCYIEGTELFKATNSYMTAPETMTSVPAFGGTSTPPFSEIQFMSTQPVINIMTTGDSVVAGQGSDDGHYIHSFVHRACRILKGKGYSVNSMNMGWGSQTSTQYEGFARDAVSAFKPEIMLYSMYTTNDTAPTQTLMDQAFARGMEFADFCKRAGTLPVFVFLAGNNLNYTPENDRLRKNLIERAKRSGIPVFDANPVTTGNGIPAIPLTGMLAANGADTVHLSDLGNETVAAAFAPELARLIDENFSDVRIAKTWRS